MLHHRILAMNAFSIALWGCAPSTYTVPPDAKLAEPSTGVDVLKPSTSASSKMLVKREEVLWLQDDLMCETALDQNDFRVLHYPPQESPRHGLSDFNRSLYRQKVADSLAAARKVKAEDEDLICYYVTQMFKSLHETGDTLERVDTDREEIIEFLKRWSINKARFSFAQGSAQYNVADEINDCLIDTHHHANVEKYLHLAGVGPETIGLRKKDLDAFKRKDRLWVARCQFIRLTRFSVGLSAKERAEHVEKIEILLREVEGRPEEIGTSKRELEALAAD